jgi:hypothetical protein
VTACMFASCPVERSFRLDYRLNGRRETVYLGRYGQRNPACSGPREVSRREARRRRGTIAGDREATGETSPEGLVQRTALDYTLGPLTTSWYTACNAVPVKLTSSR